MKAKELARMLTKDLQPEVNVDEKSRIFIDEKDQNEYDNRLMNLFIELLKEYRTLIEKHNRPAASAYNDIKLKAEMVAIRANTIWGDPPTLITKPLFATLFMAHTECVSDEKATEENIKEIIELVGGEKNYDILKSCVITSDEYRQSVQRKDVILDQQEAMNNFAPYMVVPWSELISDGITKCRMDVLHRMMAIGNYIRIGIPVEYISPLIQSTRFLEAVVKAYDATGKFILTEELANEFEKEPIKTINRIGNEYSLNLHLFNDKEEE